jgi:hypothetical protein
MTILVTYFRLQVSVDALHGCNIHIPGKGLPEARHLQPPPNPFHDPRADLLSYVQSAAPSQPVGHVSIGADTAHRKCLGRWDVSVLVQHGSVLPGSVLVSMALYCLTLYW